MNSFTRILRSPFVWGAAGLAIGLGLGATNASSWLLAIGLAAFVAYLWRLGPAENRTEGNTFAAEPALLMGWVLGFVVRGLIF